MTTTAGGAAPTSIIFGTDGWRARVADEFTFDNVRRCADGVAQYVVDQGATARGVVVAFDRRFASEHFATAAAEILLARDIPVVLAVHAVPTQMSSYEVVQRGSAAGIVITASHNPWVDNGFKIKAPSGAAAGPEILAAVEARLAVNGDERLERRPLADAEAAGLVERFDPFDGYEAFVRRTVDLDALRAADLDVLVDPLWGSGAGWLSRLLAGGRIRIHEIHTERNPYFGGVNPEPIRPNIDEALGMLAGGTFDFGLFLDGDADRAGAADERGTFIHQLEVTGLLMYYLAEHRGWRDPVVVSVNNTSMAARLGERYGIETHETPVGFKFIGPKMIETGAMMGAEESGGFGFGMHLPERDGIYADLLLLDLFMRERAAGRWPVSEAMQHFHEVAGPSFYRRIDVHVDRAEYPEVKRRLLVDLAADSPTELAGESVDHTVALDTGDGYKFFLPDGSWLLIRASGHGAVGARLHGGHLRGVAGRAARRGRGAGARLVTSDDEAARRVDKPWGHELIWAHTDRYVGKILVIETGRRLSLQRHEIKDETILVRSGRLRLFLEDDDGVVREAELGPGEHRRVPTGRVHRYEAIERCEIIEVSTPELDDVGGGGDLRHVAGLHLGPEDGVGDPGPRLLGQHHRGDDPVHQQRNGDDRPERRPGPAPVVGHAAQAGGLRPGPFDPPRRAVCAAVAPAVGPLLGPDRILRLSCRTHRANATPRTRRSRRGSPCASSCVRRRDRRRGGRRHRRRDTAARSPDPARGAEGPKRRWLLLVR